MEVLLYVIGSHSCKRKKVESGHSYQENCQAIETIIFEPDRNILCRFKLDSNGDIQAVEKTSLRSIINSNKILQVFSGIPSKENGIGIEEIAVRKGYLHIVF
jgi:hypothetical protein